MGMLPSPTRTSVGRTWSRKARAASGPQRRSQANASLMRHGGPRRRRACRCLNLRLPTLPTLRGPGSEGGYGSSSESRNPSLHCTIEDPVPRRARPGAWRAGFPRGSPTTRMLAAPLELVRPPSRPPGRRPGRLQGPNGRRQGKSRRVGWWLGGRGTESGGGGGGGAERGGAGWDKSMTRAWPWPPCSPWAARQRLRVRTAAGARSSGNSAAPCRAYLRL